MIRKIRKAAFTPRYPLNEKLLALAGYDDRYYNYKNPAGHLVFLYLCEFVRKVCTRWFDTDMENVPILDWGCGNGQVSFLLKEAGAQVTSCDIEEAPPSAILEKSGIEVVRLTHPSRLPFEDASFNAVLSFGVLEHVKDDLQSLVEIRRVLGERGLFFCFNLPSSLSWIHRLARMTGNHYHDRYYDRRKVTMLLESSGYELLDIWHRQLLPKNRVRYPGFRIFEAFDQFLTENTPLRSLSTNIEFVASKRAG